MMTLLIFSDGNNRIYASGSFREESLEKIFNKIDNLEQKSKGSFAEAD